MISGSWGESDSPGNEQRNYWSSAAATAPGARNYAGIQEPVIDELIELLIQAPDRESLVARTRALDRVLLHGYYVIPNWHLRFQRILYWDKFSPPATAAKFGTSTTLWWLDGDNVARLEKARGVARDERQSSRNSPGHPEAMVTVVVDQ